MAYTSGCTRITVNIPNKLLKEIDNHAENGSYYKMTRTQAIHELCWTGLETKTGRKRAPEYVKEAYMDMLAK